MRACNGCRKRKIKCDAATTNTWPCSACTRLKIVCVPPAIGQEGDFAAGTQGVESSGAEAPNGSEGAHHAFPVPPAYRDGNPPTMGALSSYDDMDIYSHFVQAPPSQPGMYHDMRSPPIVMPHQPYQQPPMFPGSQPASLGPDRGILPENDRSTAENLSDVLGELKIDETGIGMKAFHFGYIRLQSADLFSSKPRISGDKGKTASNQTRQSKTTSTTGSHR